MSLALSNAHARAAVLSAVWSPVDQQLVAVLMAATDKTVLKALKAELEKHNKHSCVTLSGDVKAELAGAQRGYVQLSASLDKVNAQGHVMALLHWRAHDPRVVAATAKPAVRGGDEIPPVESDYFYVVARQGQCLPTLFLERLQLALAWALQPEWAERLLELGREAELVDCLPAMTPRSPRTAPAPTHQVMDSPPRPDSVAGFLGALRVVQDEDRWGAIIGQALASGTLRL